MSASGAMVPSGGGGLGRRPSAAVVVAPVVVGSGGYGKLPLSKVDLVLASTRDWIDENTRTSDWWLPGHGDQGRLDCGHPRFMGCANSDQHPSFTTLEGVDIPAGRQYVWVGSISCFKSVCPVCFRQWAYRGAKRIEHRLNHYQGSHNRVIHAVASVPKHLWYVDPEKLRLMANRVAKKAGLDGGCVVYHPFREACRFCGVPKPPHEHICPNCGGVSFGWHYSPHFHYLGFGWIFKGNRVPDEIVQSGWIFQNFGIRDTVIGTAFYELTHCAVDYSGKGRHSVHWIGSMAYRALHVPKFVDEVRKCPVCGWELVRFKYSGVDLDLEAEPLASGGHFLEPGGWRPARVVTYHFNDY